VDLNHVGISVVDLHRSVRFYCEMLGMDVLYTAPFAGEPYAEVMGVPHARGNMSVLKNNTVQLELFQFERPEPAVRNPGEPVSSHGISHFGIEVDDIDATCRRLAAAGVKMHSPVRAFPSGMRAVYVRDPDGNVFELLQRR
jgi:catechol 2,3-dioxygenase-like lactoylglutathione lyase family enzyme